MLSNNPRHVTLTRSTVILSGDKDADRAPARDRAPSRDRAGGWERRGPSDSGRRDSYGGNDRRESRFSNDRSRPEGGRGRSEGGRAFPRDEPRRDDRGPASERREGSRPAGAPELDWW